MHLVSLNSYSYHISFAVDLHDTHLAHCLHNIGVMFDIKKEYSRSMPHYEEALAIKNAIAGFCDQDSMSLVDQIGATDNRALVFQSLYEDYETPRTNKATLSAAVTRQKIAMVYVKVCRQYFLPSALYATTCSLCLIVLISLILRICSNENTTTRSSTSLMHLEFSDKCLVKITSELEVSYHPWGMLFVVHPLIQIQPSFVTMSH